MGLLNKFRKPEKRLNSKNEILEHLADLLNTKRGFGSYPKDLGLDSYIYLGTDRKIALQIMADIKSCLQNYDKRLSEVDVIQASSKNMFSLSFLIKCKINQTPYSFRLSFQQQKEQKNAFSLEVVE